MKMTSIGSYAALAISVAFLYWTLHATSAPMPALTERPIRGARLDSPAGLYGATAAANGETKGKAKAMMSIPETGVVPIELSDLAFDDYDPPELRGPDAPALGPEDFPSEIAQLHGRDVAVEGFPLVTRFSGERIDRVLLTRFPPGCCFGNVPVLDEWIAVELQNGEMDAGTGYDPVRVQGRFRAAELLDDKGFVQSLYRLSEAEVLR